MHFFLGTTNTDKIREIGSILTATGCTFSPTDPIDPDETEQDFEGNAILKARVYAQHAGGLTLSEDSGLVIPKLKGLPGPWSARFSDFLEVDVSAGSVKGYAPKELPRKERDLLNNARVLELMHDVEQPYRAAFFKVVLVVADAQGGIHFRASAESHGWIAEESRGSNGFGYDPIFVGSDTFGKTYAELDAARKNLRSHRKRVLKEFTAWLAATIKRPPPTSITIDGNDGTGKTTLVRSLQALGYKVNDRGIATQMTDHDGLIPKEQELIIILDAPVECSRQRLALAGRDLNEKYHTVEDLTYYRARFLEVAKKLPTCVVMNAARDADTVLASVVGVLNQFGFKPQPR